MAQTEELLAELKTMQSDERLPAEVRDRIRNIARGIEENLEVARGIEEGCKAAITCDLEEGGICSQCGKPYLRPACGPTHALIAEEEIRRIVARAVERGDEGTYVATYLRNYM